MPWSISVIFFGNFFTNHLLILIIDNRQDCQTESKTGNLQEVLLSLTSSTILRYWKTGRNFQAPPAIRLAQRKCLF